MFNKLANLKHCNGEVAGDGFRQLGVEQQNRV